MTASRIETMGVTGSEYGGVGVRSVGIYGGVGGLY